MIKLKLPGKLRGHIDAVSTTLVSGWVMHEAKPAKRVGVEVRLGDRVIASGLAETFRSDLLANGLGDGRYGFNIILPAGIEVADLKNIRLTDVGTGKEFAKYVPKNRQSASLWDLLFDHDYYASQLVGQSQDSSGSDLAAHFRAKGWAEGLNPHPLFDTGFYQSQLSQPLKVDPISHFLAQGQAQLIRPHPLCDIDFYYDNRPDVREANIHPLLHFLQYAAAEGTKLSPLFDEQNYRQLLDKDRVDGPLLIHYLKFGWREGLRPHTSFDPILYQRLMGYSDHVEPYTAFLKTFVGVKHQALTNKSDVRFSFIILNLNKTLLTLQCLAFVRRFTPLADYEIIVVDNGSGWDQFALLCDYGIGIKIVRLENNAGFGEGNNVAVEQARGEFLIFLNNDAFVTEGWLEPLVAELDADPSIGAVGPKFIYPDGTLQEAGGTLSSCGASVRHGNGLNADDPLFNRSKVVDYCSAATLVIRAESFRRILGYDLSFDPAYYEDADLCLKLRLIGQKVVYVANAEVVHLEHITASDPNLGFRIDTVNYTNRMKFVARWGKFLAGESDGAAEKSLIPSPLLFSTSEEHKLKRLALYSPYPLTPGGGERYLLSLAAVLGNDYDCTLYTHDQYSRTRLLTLARELDLQLDHVSVKPWKMAGEADKYDVFICMSNHILPGAPAIGRLNLFLCQFPFPMPPGVYARDWGNLRRYDAMIVYSRFVVDHASSAAARLGLVLPPCHILSPPVPQIEPARVPLTGADFHIVNVGRFTPSGHCKRQDVMIDAFAEIVERVHRPVQLHLAGALGGSAIDRDYLMSLQRAARGLPISFHLNAMPEQIHALYRDASAYWHMTGADDDVRHKPERFEHFGITIGEAMSAGAIPISLRHGGPGEIIADGINGFLVSDKNELRDRTIKLINGEVRNVTEMRAAARRRAAEFSMKALEDHLRAIIRAPDQTTV